MGLDLLHFILLNVFCHELSQRVIINHISGQNCSRCCVKCDYLGACCISGETHFSAFRLRTSCCLTHPLRERLTLSTLMLGMKGAPFKALFVLRRVPKQWQRWDQKLWMSCSFNGRSPVRQTNSFFSSAKKKKETTSRKQHG